MLRVKFLNLSEYSLELQTLYKRSVDIYQQSLELIQSILEGSTITFKKIKSHSLQFENVHFKFDIKRDNQRRSEGTLKISDLFSRSLIRKEQGENTNIEFDQFIEMYNYLKEIEDILKKSHFNGFDLARFIKKKVRVKKKSLQNLKKLYNEVKENFEKLSLFIEEKRADPEYFFLNYFSGTQIRNINEENLKGILNYLKWWNIDEIDTFSPTFFGLKQAYSNSGKKKMFNFIFL